MYETGADSAVTVLRCGLCNKPFDKHSTLKRHGYYCRSRRATGIGVRPRSCVPCAKAKAACNNRRPDCSRCVARSIGCHYPNDKATTGIPAAGLKYHHPEDDSAIGSESATTSTSLIDRTPSNSTSTESRQLTSDGMGIVAEDSLILTPGGSFTDPDLGVDYLDWANTGITVDNFLMMDAQTESHLNELPSSPRSRQSTPHVTDSTGAIRAQQRFSSGFHIPRAPSQAFRSLIQRPNMPAALQRVVNLILHTLKSYPRMMMHPETLPPFIHPKSLSLGIESAHMEPLSNCISLVRMIAEGVPGSRKLFWKNVRLECERWIEQHMVLVQWELITAMQALSIYILIRVDEGETGDSTMDYPLVKAVTLIAQQLSRSDVECHTECTLCSTGLEMSWKEWVLRESRRRLAIVYRVVNMLFYFEPAAMCNLPKDLALAPLPAKRQLWEAGDQLTWKAECQREPGFDISFGLATNGEIVKLDEGSLSCNDTWLFYHSSEPAKSPHRSAARWEDWCSGMDGLGGLIMLAASLIV